MTASLPKSERVVHVDFSRTRPEVPPRLSGQGKKPAMRVVPPTRHDGNVQEPASIVAMALLIARKTRADTLDGDLEVICRLLRQNCAWSDESLIMLKHTVATALDHARQAHPRGVAAD